METLFLYNAENLTPTTSTVSLHATEMLGSSKGRSNEGSLNSNLPLALYPTNTQGPKVTMDLFISNSLLSSVPSSKWELVWVN